MATTHGSEAKPHLLKKESCKMNFWTNSALWQTAGLLIVSNCFMTYAWYGHLKTLGTKPLLLAVLVSWGVAFFEYLVQVPANRIGYRGQLELGQLKIMQEVIALTVFIPFSIWYMKEPIRLNYLWAGLCMAGAVYFIFKS